MTLDNAVFRASLSRFASGVTVLTTRTADGEDLGMTVKMHDRMLSEYYMLPMNMDRDPDPKAQATRTVDTPAQDGSILPQ